MDEVVKTANEATRALSDEQVRQRIVQLAFGGNEERWRAFVEALRAVVPRDASVVLRGSVVTGVRWADGATFDAEGVGTSDLDLTLVGGDMLKLFEAHYIPGLHSVPLSDDNPEAAPALLPLRRALCALTNRPVNIQATSSIVQYARDVLMDQPYFTVLEKEERPEDHPDGRIAWREGTVLDDTAGHRGSAGAGGG
ncbi:MAG: hypothetical protein ACYC3Q_09660 [Gemmatimonadaceae bacterium]